MDPSDLNVSDCVRFPDESIKQAVGSVLKPLVTSKQGKELTTQLSEDIADELAADPSFKDLMGRAHSEMLAWAQFDLTCQAMKGVLAEAQKMAVKGKITGETDLESLLKPKFDQVVTKPIDKCELLKTDAWRDYVAKMKEFDVELNEVDGDDDDEEMLVTSEETNLTCPITRKKFVNPVKNMKCGHTYDQEGIDMLLAQRPSFRCPVQSCSNKDKVTKADLEPDRRTMRLIKSKGI